MSVFWIVALLFLGAALAMLMPPLLLRAGAVGEAPTPGHVNLAVLRDQLREARADLAAGTISAERLAQLHAELEQRVLEEAAPGDAPAARAAAARRSAYGLALVLPLASVLVYLALGRPELLRTGAPVSTGSHGTAPDQIRHLIATLSARLEAQPTDVQGWAMLGRSYLALGRYRDAATALGRASALAPGDATLLADQADVLGMAQGKRLAGAPARLVQQALDADPRHAKALALAGSVAFEAHDYAAARLYWERLLAVVPAGSELARSVRGSIMQAGALERGEGTSAAVPPAAVPARGGMASSADAAPATVAGQVELAPALAARVGATDTLFVFARAVTGSRMPLAVVRRPVGAWPATFELDDSTAMSAERRLSGQREVVIAARISRSGSATPQAGDLIGQTGVLSPGARGVRITIDRVQP